MVIEISDVRERKKKEILAKFLLRTGVINRPPCFRCKHKVPKLLVDLDTNKDCITITAHCHGEKETNYIPVRKIDYIGKIEIGWAFQPIKGSDKKLEKSEENPDELRKLSKDRLIEAPKH